MPAPGSNADGGHRRRLARVAALAGLAACALSVCASSARGQRPERPASAERVEHAARVERVARAPGADDARRPAAALARMHRTGWANADTLMLAGGHKVLRSADGYLWLASPLGLLRFDGVRFTLVDGASAPALRSARSGMFMPRLVDRHGVMWVARPDGALLGYRDGTFEVVLPPERATATEVVEDGAGRLWTWRRGATSLARLRAGRREHRPLPPELPVTAVTGIVRDTADGLWLGTLFDGLWHLTAGGAARRVPSPVVRAENSVRPLLQTRDGTLWAIGGGLGDGLHRLDGGRWTRVRLPEAPERPIFAREAVEDADGAVWFATNGDGVLRWRDGRLERYARADGLSSATVHSLHVDAEGSAWIATDAGLDRLRPAVLSMLSARDGLPFDVAARVVEDAEGFVWAKAFASESFYRLDGAPVRNHGPLAVTAVSVPPGEGYQLLGPARGGGVWIAPNLGGLAHLDARGMRRIDAQVGFPRARLWHALEARDGTLWLAILWGGFGRVRDGRWAPLPLPGVDPVRVAALAEDGRGHVWVTVQDAPFVYELAGDRVARRLGAGDGLPAPITHLAAGDGDTLWGTSTDALVRIAGGRVSVVPARSIGHVLHAEPSAIVAGDRLWIASQGGIVHLSLAALHRIADGADEPLAPTTITALDGIPVPKTPARTVHPVSRGRDGRFWVNTPAGLAIVDPSRVARNPHPPRVFVEEVAVSGRRVPTDAPVTLGPRPDRVDIRFTATSLLMPERVRLEYRLEGADDGWRTAGIPRLATYTQLRPGAYRFRVRAWNEDGVPSPQEATLAIRVPPMWFETWWFAALALLGVASLGAGGVLAVQRSRERRRAERLRARFEATLGERTRLARELHDTLLQGFTGITLQLEAVQRTITTAPREAAASLARVLSLADLTLRDARQMVWDMRAPELDGHDVADALAGAARGAVGGTDVALQLTVRGRRRRLAPDAEIAALRIGREAVANAVKHARPTRVAVEVAYEPSAIRVRVLDDGTGFDPAAAERDGHLGIRTMRERASRAGGTLAISSAPGQGTEVSVTLPSDAAR